MNAPPPRLRPLFSPAGLVRLLLVILAIPAVLLGSLAALVLAGLLMPVALLGLALQPWLALRHGRRPPAGPAGAGGEAAAPGADGQPLPQRPPTAWH